MRQREGQVLGEELLDVGALDIVGLLELDDAEDLARHIVSFSPVLGSVPSGAWCVFRLDSTYVDGSETGTVAGGHVLVHSLDGLGPGHLAVLLVHVVGTGARVVSDPDAEVLDLQGVLLVNLERKNA